MTIAADAFGGSSSTPRGIAGFYSAQWSPPIDYTTTNTLPTAAAAVAAGLSSSSSSNALSISDALCGSAGWTATAAVAAGRRQQQQSPMLVSSGSSSNTLYHSSSSSTLYNSCSDQSPVELLQLQQQQQQHRSHDRVHSYADAMHDALTGGTGNSTAAATGGSGVNISAMEDCDGLLRIGSGSFRRSASGSSFAYDSMDWYVYYELSSIIIHVL
jgi:hypothetical protein